MKGGGVFRLLSCNNSVFLEVVFSIMLKNTSTTIQQRLVFWVHKIFPAGKNHLKHGLLYKFIKTIDKGPVQSLFQISK